MESVRFPGKVLAPLVGKPVIRHVLDACKRTGIRTVVALATNDLGGPLPAYLSACGDAWHAPKCALNDVLSRYALTAQAYHAAYPIIRITGDCPLVDAAWIRTMLDDYQGDTSLPYYGVTNDPDGNDVEIFSASLLQERDGTSDDAHEREHVTSWMRRHANARRVSSRGFEDVKYSVDTIADLRVCAELIRRAGIGASWKSYVAAYRDYRMAQMSYLEIK